MQWYYALSGSQLGPVSLEELQNLARSGTLRPDTLVWRNGLPNWIPASQVPDVTMPFADQVLAPTPGVSPAASPYAPPPSSFRSGSMAPSSAHDINSTPALIMGIVCALFCCIPTGIVAIIYAAQVSTKVAQQDYEGARRNIKTSYIWSGVSLGLGIIFFIGYLGLILAGVAVE